MKTQFMFFCYRVRIIHETNAKLFLHRNNRKSWRIDISTMTYNQTNFEMRLNKDICLIMQTVIQAVFVLTRVFHCYISTKHMVLIHADDQNLDKRESRRKYPD